MSYILAVLLPPVAVLFTGRPVQVLINVLLTIIGWIPGVIHALYVVHKSK
ncbi:YqaE/Pmp3 family membrane protein [Virgibacillus sp. DJP39]